MANSPASLVNGGLDRGIDAFLLDTAKLGQIPQRVRDYLARREVDPGVIGGRADDPALQDRMSRYIASRGARLNDDPTFQGGGYDEILFAAYDEALRTRSGARTDPLDIVRTPQADPATEGWDFRVEDFATIERQGVLPDSIRAAGAIDYVFELGERLGVFGLAEALVLDWSTGSVDVADGAAAGKLYRYWKLLDQRSSAEERGMLYRRVLDKGGAQVLSGGVINEAFPALWNQLMTEIADYIDKSEQVDSGRTDDSPVSTRPLHYALRELQYNLTEHCTGMAFIQARELYAQLQQAFDLFRDPDIIASFGGVRRRNMWTVIEQLARRRLDRTVPVGPVVRLAVDGNRLFQIAAEFDEGTFSQQQLTELLEAGESYIINASVVSKTLGEPLLETEDEEEEDEREMESESDEDF